MEKNKESLLAKIKLMTGEQMNILNNDFFNQEVESLKRRIEQVECTKTHEEIVETSLEEVSELQRDTSALLALQEEAAPAEAAPQCPDFEAMANLSPGIHILPRIRRPSSESQN